MSRTIQVIINGQVHQISAVGRRALTVRETDRVQIMVRTDAGDEPFEVLVEDYSAPLERVSVDGEILWQTPPEHYFAESFGHSTVCILFPQGTELIDFDVLAKKTTSDQAKKMIQYLANYSESLISSCFARTTRPVGSRRDDEAEPETLLSMAEKVITVMQNSQAELLRNVRERLVPQRVPLWQSDMTNSQEIDPVDVLTNLDALVPSASLGDVFLAGRHYDLASIDVSQLLPTCDVEENRILLGGLYSIRRQVSNLQERLKAFDSERSSNPTGEYESLSRLLLSLTAGGMLRRCRDVLQSADGFIRIFEHRLGVTYKGEIAPVMTGYARTTRVYRILFTYLAQWYEIGTPSMEGMNFLLKLKSLWKIYELFVLFHLIAELQRQGWVGEQHTPHLTMGPYVPATMTFSHGDERLILQYEPTIRKHGIDTVNLDLVDVLHDYRSEHSYWTPDFVLRFSRGTQVRYMILDAKYSTRQKVSEFSLPKLFKKYYLGTAAYDATFGVYTSEPITAVFAVFALDYRDSRYLPYWKGQGLQDNAIRLPMVGGIGLMTDNDTLFNKSIAAAMATTRHMLGPRTPVVPAPVLARISGPI